MMANEESTEIVCFISPGAEGLVSGRGHTFKNFFNTLGDGWCPTVKTGYIADFLCHCWFLLIVWWGCWSDKKSCTVSDTQVIVKAHGPLVCFPYWTLRIHQEYIIAFQDKINYREITVRERMYKNFMMWWFNMKHRFEKSV